MILRRPIGWQTDEIVSSRCVRPASLPTPRNDARRSRDVQAHSGPGIAPVDPPEVPGPRARPRLPHGCGAP